MKNFIKNLHRSRIFSLLIWLAIMFIAIIALPNINDVAGNAGVPQMTSNSKIMKAQRVQANWGNDTSNTKIMNVVYHAKKGKITKDQQNDIYQKVGKIQNDNGSNGIGKIITAHTSPNGQAKFISNNGSTEIVELHVNNAVAGSQSFAASIQNAFETNDGLETNVTNSELTNQVSNANILHITNIVSIVGFILALLFIAISFKSLIAPLLAFITFYISYLFSISATALMSTKLGFPYSVYTPLTTTIVVLVLGTMATFFLYRKFEYNLQEGEEENEAANNAVHKLSYPLIAIATILSIAFGSFFFLGFNPVSALSGLFAPLFATVAAVLTINPLFMSLLGDTFFWPQKTTPKMFNQNVWNSLTHVGLWKPVMAIAAVLVVVLPFALFYRPNDTYLNNNNLTFNDQVSNANRILQENFGSGKTTPVTVYIKSNNKNPFNTENTLNPIDQVTTKLDSMKNVQSVYSVTQPGGQQIGKYYLKDQLTNTNKSLKSVISAIKKDRKQIANSKEKLSPSGLNDQINTLNSLIGKVNSASDSTVRTPTSVPYASTASRVGRRSHGAQQTLRGLNTQLSSQTQELNSLRSQIGNINSNVSSVKSGLQSYSSQLSSAQDQLTEVDNSLKISEKQLKSDSNYITGIQNSVAGQTYYATPQDINDTDFYQTMSNFNDENGTATMLEVQFKNVPDGQINVNNIHHMEQEIYTQLQGTQLNGAQVSYSGQPVENAYIKQQFSKTFTAALILMVAILLLGLIIVSRSIVQPLWWLLTFILSSFAGLQVTELLMNFATLDNQLNWNAFNALLVPLSLIAATELTFLAVSYRKYNPDILGWLHSGIDNFGKTVSYLVIAAILVSIALFFGFLHQFDYIALTVIFTTIIFNIALPILMAALGKLSLSLPLTKIHEWATIFKKIR